MKNFLSLDNLIFQEKDPISNFIQSSSEVSECSITNVLEENSSSIWISNEELPQEIILNLSRSFFKEYPKKLSAIGIYCWHAYPTNPKLVEVLISKNNDDNFISFGNFDLCLKPGRQLLQLDEENDTNFLNTENNNYIIKILIKETFGDKRTYINNIYLYENLDFMGSGIINSFNPIDTIKEEDDSSSIFYLRESRERTLPRKKINNSVNNNISTNKINNDTLTKEISIPNQSQLNSNLNNMMIKTHSDELKNKDLTIDEFEIITKTKNKGNKSNDKLIQNRNINSENILIKNNYENDESNIIINNNIIGTDSQFNITEISERNNNIKNDDITNQNILLTKTNDEIDEKLNNSNNKNIEINKQLNVNNIENKLNKKTSNAESLDVTLSSDDLENFGFLKGTKTHHNNFFNPPKISESTDELENFEFQHSSGDNKHKNKIDISEKKIMENYFNMQNSSNKKNNNNISQNKKTKSNINCMSQKNIQKENNNINKPKGKNKNLNKKRENEIKQLKQELSSIKSEFENYKKEQQEISKKYQDKITLFETHIKKLTTNSNKMNDVVKTLLEAQYIQNQTTNDFITNQMRRIATETFVNIFSNISQFANLAQPQNPVISIPNPNQEPIDNININNLNDKDRQQTYQTTRRKKYSIDRINKKLNNKSLNNIEISDSKDSNKGNKIYNKKINETNIKANKLKKYNSGRNIVLRKNYISQNQINNYINPENKNNYANNESLENNTENIDNNDKEQINENYFYQTGYPTDGDKNITPFQKVQKINNINSNEILKINNNEFHSNLISKRKEIIHKRLLSNYYKKKTSSPIKKAKSSNISYPESRHLYPETTANISNQNKNINFNINENEEKENNSEIYSDEDVPLKVSQLKTEKGNYLINNSNNRNKEKNNYDEEKENDNEIDNETRTNSEVRDTFPNLKKNKLGDKLNEDNKFQIKQNLNSNEEQKCTKDSDKNINNKKRKIKSKKNESLINLIQQFNNNNKELNKMDNE